MLNGTNRTKTIYHIIFFSTSYLIPLVLISGLYLRMCIRLWQTVVGGNMSAESQRGRKRVTRLVVVVVFAFASLWFPIQVIAIYDKLFSNSSGIFLDNGAFRSRFSNIVLTFSDDSTVEEHRFVPHSYDVRRTFTSHIARDCIHEFLHQSGLIRFPFREFPKGI